MQKKKNIPAFLRSTYAMLERAELSHIVAWGEGGNGFVIKDLAQFSSEILPQYFKHQKYTSFVRQLNMYGFHKQRSHELAADHNHQYFAHEHFRRGDAQTREEGARMLLAAIRRKPQKKKKASMTHSIPQTDPQQQQEAAEVESFDSARSVSLEVEAEQKDHQKSSLQQSQGRQQQEWAQESEQFDEATEQVMMQNELLRGLHGVIRSQVLEAKKRSIARMTLPNSNPLIQKQEQASIAKLSSLLMEAVAAAEMQLATVE